MLKKVLAVVAIVGIMGLPALAFQASQQDKEVALKEAAADRASKEAMGAKANLGMALAFALGAAAIGGALGQSNAIGKAVDAVARQPEAGARVQGMMIIGLALIETLVIYVLLICFVWGGKLGN